MSSPAPPAATASANPSPLAIGRTFLKQFYHVLTTSPDMIYKFYNPSSVLSHGEGSKPTTPTTMESLKDPKDLKDRFFSWAANPEDPVRFELENGAIDAQESINGGVLLVVTGHMYLGEDNRRPFCHTFFLHPFSPPNSTKRSYYVHNDILRFLQVDDFRDAGAVAPEETSPGEDQPVSAQVDDLHQAAAPAAAEEEIEETVEEKPPVQETKQEVSTQAVPEQNTDQEEAVEESKDDPIAEEAVEETKEEVVILEEAKEDVSKQRKTKGKKNGKPEQPPASTKPPAGSWASLVASSADKPVPPAPPKKPVPASAPKAAPFPPAPTPAPVTVATEPTVSQEDDDETTPTEPLPNKSTSDHVRRHRRDPDNTLVVKNVPDGAKEADIRALFEPFATATNTKVVGITVSAHRGLAFVDYDSAAPVVAALESPVRPFSLNGRVLDMEQKTMDVQRRAARGGGGGGSGRNAPPTSRSGAENGGRGSRDGRVGGPRRSTGGRDGRGGGDRGGGGRNGR